MKLDNLLFPHPILGLGDDISGNIELVNPQIISYSDEYEINVTLQFENNDLLNLIDTNTAEYYCEVNCSNTLFRKVYCSDAETLKFFLPKKEVKGKVVFDFYIVAKDAISDYTNSSANPDIREYKFDIDKGDILAYFGKFEFNADIKYNKLKAVSSFLEIVPSEDSTFLVVDLDSPKIVVKMPLDEFEIFSNNSISKNQDYSAIIHSSVVLNSLLIALYNYKQYLHDEKLWALTIEHRLKDKEFDSLSVEEPANIPEIAQRLLGMPFKRLLSQLQSSFNSINED